MDLHVEQLLRIRSDVQDPLLQNLACSAFAPNGFRAATHEAVLRQNMDAECGGSTLEVIRTGAAKERKGISRPRHREQPIRQTVESAVSANPTDESGMPAPKRTRSVAMLCPWAANALSTKPGSESAAGIA